MISPSPTDDAPTTARLTVTGGRTIGGRAPLVGDKSISHRILLLGALADGPTRITNLSPCADVRRTRAAVEALGVPVEDAADGTVVVAGSGVCGLGGPPVRIDCGDSGTTMRLLAGLLAGQPRRFTLTAAAGLRRRPMDRVITPLRAMGADIRAHDGRAPLVGSGGRLVGADIVLPHASAQVASAVLLAGLNAEGTTRVRYPAPVRDHTERLLAEMGAPIRFDMRSATLDGPVVRLDPANGGTYAVPDDPSAAAFLLAAAAIVPGAEVRLSGVGLNPGRTGFLDALEAMGADIAIDGWREHGGEPVGDIVLRHRPLHAAGIAGALVPRSIDELPLLAVVATQAVGTTVIRDAAELRVKECDRIEAIAAGLARLGAEIEVRPDGWAITGPTPLVGADVDGADDHRIVMALAVAGLAAHGTTVVSGASRVADSYPRFVEALVALGGQIEVTAGP